MLIKGSTWVPIEAPAIDFPLILGDRKTFAEEDFVPADQVMPEYVGELLYPRYSPQQVWYSLKDQQQHEMVLFSSYDSIISGNGGGNVKFM